MIQIIPAAHQLEGVGIFKPYNVFIPPLHGKAHSQRRHRAQHQNTHNGVGAVIFSHAENHIVDPENPRSLIEKSLSACQRLKAERDHSPKQQINPCRHKRHRQKSISHHIAIPFQGHKISIAQYPRAKNSFCKQPDPLLPHILILLCRRNHPQNTAADNIPIALPRKYPIDCQIYGGCDKNRL